MSAWTLLFHVLRCLLNWQHRLAVLSCKKELPLPPLKIKPAAVCASFLVSGPVEIIHNCRRLPPQSMTACSLTFNLQPRLRPLPSRTHFIFLFWSRRRCVTAPSFALTDHKTFLPPFHLSPVTYISTAPVQYCGSRVILVPPARRPSQAEN